MPSQIASISTSRSPSFQNISYNFCASQDISRVIKSATIYLKYDIGMVQFPISFHRLQINLASSCNLLFGLLYCVSLLFASGIEVSSWNMFSSQRIGIDYYNVTYSSSLYLFNLFNNSLVKIVSFSRDVLFYGFESEFCEYFRDVIISFNCYLNFDSITSSLLQFVCFIISKSHSNLKLYIALKSLIIIFINLWRVRMSKKIEHHQSKSLWNYTLSPGWKPEEVQILKLALQKFGIGKWRRIVKSKCLPGKSIGQIYMQTQRLVGQQSLGDFMGLHLDLQKVFQENMKKTGVTRKNNFIINTSNNPTKEQRKRRIEQNKQKYGLSREQVKLIKLPRWRTEGFLTLDEIETDKLSTLEKLIHLQTLRKQIEMRLNSK